MSFRTFAQFLISMSRPLALLFLVLALVFSATAPVMAGTPYEYSDGSEGDPGDGVLDPRAREEMVTPLPVPADQNLILTRSFVLIPLFSGWNSPGYGLPGFWWFSQTGTGHPFLNGPSPWSRPLSGRGWRNAR